MESETLRCGEIVKSLLTFSRQSKMTIKAHRLEDIIDKTLILIAHDLSLRGVQCVKKTSGDLPPIECDFKQIQQVILNLMGNAAEAMEGGGTLTIKAKISEKAGFMEVAVSDTGEGIAGENLSSIFEPFFTTKAEGAGVGLGLSVAYGIVMRHNGFIEVESEPMKGSTFRVLLPIVQIPQEEFGRT
jgi:signal transduction histidine kinase